MLMINLGCFMLGRLFLFILLLALSLGQFSIAFATDDVSDLLSDENKINNLSGDENCVARWDILWDWAKKGEMKARFTLLVSMMPLPDTGAVRMPGNNGDYVSNSKDVITMAVHSWEYIGDSDNESKEFVKNYKAVILNVFMMAGLDRIESGKKFIDCIGKSDGRTCSRLAVDEGLVPSFEIYSAQIDAMKSKGISPYCEPYKIRKYNKQ